jgi:GcrA cell cycle regulator
MAWTDEMIEDLTTMWKEGLTTAEIAKKLGVSKNSIVGKVHRLNLPARPSPIKKKEDDSPELALEPKPVKVTPAPAKVKPAVEKPVTVEKHVAEAPVPASVPQPKVKKSNGLTLTELDNHTCRWPLGDPRDENFCFCGKKVRAGQTYCEEHAAVAYVKPVKKS